MAQLFYIYAVTSQNNMILGNVWPFAEPGLQTLRANPISEILEKLNSIGSTKQSVLRG